VLTDAGRTLLAQAYPIVEAFDCSSFEGLTDSERADLTRPSNKVLAGGRLSGE